MPDAADPRLRGLAGITVESHGVICITTQLARHRTDRQKQAVVAEKGRRAVTRVQVAGRFGTAASAALVECRLETGRTHQIRVHLAYAGQWFFFALTALVIYVLALRRKATRARAD